jgi:hypothetical protein
MRNIQNLSKGWRVHLNDGTFYNNTILQLGADFHEATDYANTAWHLT